MRPLLVGAVVALFTLGALPAVLGALDMGYLFRLSELTMIFAMLQMPLVKRYHLEPATAEASDTERGKTGKS